MPRIEVLDGLRGYFLACMMINHLKFSGGNWVARFNQGEFGYVQDAQGFVFLSGLLVGLIYSRRMAASGFGPCARKMWRRALEIYAYALLCLFGIVLLTALIPNAGAAWSQWLWGLGYRDPGYMASAAILLFQPNYIDILPQYILYMLAAPGLVWLCLTGRWLGVCIFSFVCWLAVQFGLHMPIGNAARFAAASWQTPDLVRIYFNPLAWQVCFVAGLVLGTLTVVRGVRWGQVLRAQPKSLVWGAVLVLLMCAFVRLGMTHQFHSGELARHIRTLDQKENFGLLYLANFAAAAFLMTWVLIAGPFARSGLLRHVAAWIRAALSLPFLRLLGRNSLQVYTLHVFLVYLTRLLEDASGPFSQGMKLCLVVANIALLGGLAWLYAHWPSRSRARKYGDLAEQSLRTPLSLSGRVLQKSDRS